MLIHQWKNKGMLVPVYTIGCFVAFNMSLGILRRHFGGVFNKIGYVYPAVCSLVVSGLWIYLTCEEYYRDKEGNKKKLDIPHEFYWIKMKYWAYINWGLAASLLVYKLVHSL